VINSAWRDGIGSSIACGIRRLQAQAVEVDSVLLLVCDQPFVRPTVLRQLIETQTATAKAIVACAYANTVGVPALFDRSCFDELLGLTGDTGAKKIIMRDQTRVATIAFPEGKIDIDTWEDYQLFMSGTGEREPQ
jgi:molybdenum cofactor cytidylyltransferase